MFYKNSNVIIWCNFQAFSFILFLEKFLMDAEEHNRQKLTAHLDQTTFQQMMDFTEKARKDLAIKDV